MSIHNGLIALERCLFLLGKGVITIGASLNHLEASLKREISRIYKQFIGKGPDDTTVKIFENIIIIKLLGALTQLEKTLLESEKGDELVEKVRNELIASKKSEYIPVIEKIVDTKVLKGDYIIEKTNNIIYIFFVLEKEIENLIE